jgi:hypothetical protein
MKTMDSKDLLLNNHNSEIVAVAFTSSFLILLLNFLRLSWWIKPNSRSGEIIVVASEHQLLTDGDTEE